jgi:hypothetical protein
MKGELHLSQNAAQVIFISLSPAAAAVASKTRDKHNDDNEYVEELRTSKKALKFSLLRNGRSVSARLFFYFYIARCCVRANNVSLL